VADRPNVSNTITRNTTSPGGLVVIYYLRLKEYAESDKDKNRNCDDTYSNVAINRSWNYRGNRSAAASTISVHY